MIDRRSRRSTPMTLAHLFPPCDDGKRHGALLLPLLGPFSVGGHGAEGWFWR